MSELLPLMDLLGHNNMHFLNKSTSESVKRHFSARNLSEASDLAKLSSSSVIITATDARCDLN